MRLGVIGGSAFPSDWSEWAGFSRADELDHAASPALVSEWGEPSAPLLGVRYADTDVLFLARHGAQHHLLPSEINYRANLRLFQDAAVDAIIATHTVGGIDPTIPIGGLTLPTQVIDYTWGRADTYAGNGTVEHVPFDHPFHPALIEQLRGVAQERSVPLAVGGVYGCTQGPRFESPAEIDRFERDGVSLVGMTAMPEACLAAELAVPYASISLVVNAAAGRGEIELEAIHRAGREGMANIQSLLTGLLQQGKLFL